MSTARHRVVLTGAFGGQAFNTGEDMRNSLSLLELMRLLEVGRDDARGKGRTLEWLANNRR